MTEAQLKAFPAFQTLPIYDESDARANTLTAAAGPYRAVRECWTLQQVEDCLKDTKFIPLGGLRAGTPGAPVVVAYFGEKK